MQYLRQRDQTPCMTPRIVFNDLSDTLTDMNVTLTKINNNSLLASGSNWNITYAFDDKLTLTIESKRKGTYVLPIIKNGNVVIGKNYAEIGNVVVFAENICYNKNNSGFNQVGGFIWETLEIPINGKAIITISVKEK